MAVNGITEHVSVPRPPILGDAKKTAEEISVLRPAGARRDESRQEVAAEKVKEAPEPKIDPEKLVLQPGEVPLEDRLKQVISLEDLQRLLLLRSPFPGDVEPGSPGFLFDLRG